MEDADGRHDADADRGPPGHLVGLPDELDLAARDGIIELDALLGESPRWWEHDRAMAPRTGFEPVLPA